MYPAISPLRARLFLAAVFALLGPFNATADEGVKSSAQKPIRAVIFTGGCCHDYNRQKLLLMDGIGRRTPVDWTVVHEGGTGNHHIYPLLQKKDWSRDFDIVVYNMCFAKTNDEAYIKNILKPHEAGLPAIVIHCTMHTFRSLKDDMWRKFLGVTTVRHGAHFPIHVHTVEPDHPILQGLPKEWKTPKGELYHIQKVWDTATPLAVGTREASLDDSGHPCVWVNTFGKAKVFGTTLGHHNETMQQTHYLDMVARGMLWTLERLDEKHFRRVTAKEDAEAQKNLGPKGKAPTPIKKPNAGKTGGKKIKVPNNLALGKMTSASATQPARDTRFAVDGRLDTRWCAPDNGNGHWWQVDLGKPGRATGCEIVWEFAGRRYRYKVEGSSDGSTWRMLADATKSVLREQIHTHKFDASDFRFFRITGTEMESGAWMSFSEFHVHGTEFVEVAAPIEPTKLKQANKQGLLARVQAPTGFRTTLFAAPPNINYPACVASAPTGEVFVGIDENGSLGKDPTRRQLIVSCKDTDGDGVADKFTTFAEKVGSVRGLFVDGNKVWALHPPLLRVFYDDDGDGKADRNEVLVEGLGTPALKARGADHCTNGFRVGIDGWLYIAIGDFGFTRAVGKDGRELQMHGGGIIRVRLDGTEMETYATGLRNIYDVAIDPLMNGFTRDNTNDGGGWDIRVSHIFPTAEYGYPRLFKNFSDEIVQPLGIFGGGSGTGKLYVHEPGLPAGYGNALYTCDWGRNAVYVHSVEPKGAGFSTDQKTFVQLPRPTDLDVDGQGRVTIASWHNGQFAFKGPDVGFLVQLTPENAKSEPFPDLKNASETDLLRHLASLSHTHRLYAQREILARGTKDVAAGLRKHAADRDALLAGRVAAVFTIKQLLGSAARDVLLPLAADNAIREFVIRALADRKGEVADLPLEQFVGGLGDKDPRVRLQAAVALGRLGKIGAGDALATAAADDDPLVAHTAIRALVELRASEACLAALDRGSVDIARGAARALQSLHEPKVVDGLIARLQRARSDEVQIFVFRALCRLYHREAPWNGQWWGTRPNTTGPYYKLATWEETTKIGEVLKFAVASAGSERSKDLLLELNRHQVKLGNAAPQLFKLAESDTSLRPAALTLLQQQVTIPGEAVPLIKASAATKSGNPAVQAKALLLLARLGAKPDMRETVHKVFAEVDAGKITSEAVMIARDQYVYDVRQATRIDFFITQLKTDAAPQRELAAMILMALADNKRVADPLRKAAATAIEEAWTNPDCIAALLRAAGRTRSGNYATRVARHLKAGDVNNAAGRFAAKLLGLDDNGDKKHPPGQLIEKTGYEAAVSQAAGRAGDLSLGRHLFLRQGCINCHTISGVEPPRGPQLIDIGRRYNRRELAESILKPSAKIAQGFDTQWFETDKGLVINGFVVSESGESVEVRTTEGTSKTIAKTEIEERGKTDISSMPKGLAGELTLDELASLLTYLESLSSE
ncbi:MAG: ThuA domain-containing protein [Pirellulales bacterium]